jgi:hypothetical protein
MNRYEHTSLSFLHAAEKISHRLSFNETEPEALVYLIKGTKEWDQVHSIGLSTTEIIGIDIYISNIVPLGGVAKLLIIPKLIDGLSDKYYVNREHYLVKKIDSASVHFPHKYHWKQKYLKRLYAIDAASKTAIDEAKDLALDMMKDIPSGALLSGAISGSNDAEMRKNLADYERGLIKAKELGFNVFNPLPFQSLFNQICEIHGNHETYAGQILLDRFFFHLMKTFEFLLQLPSWKFSVGANAEFKKALELGKTIIEFSPDATTNADMRIQQETNQIESLQ